MGDHLTTKRGGSTTGPSLTSTKQRGPREAYTECGGEGKTVAAVKALAGKPLHDAKTSIPGKK